MCHQSSRSPCAAIHTYPPIVRTTCHTYAPCRWDSVRLTKESNPRSMQLEDAYGYSLRTKSGYDGTGRQGMLLRDSARGGGCDCSCSGSWKRDTPVPTSFLGRSPERRKYPKTVTDSHFHRIDEKEEENNNSNAILHQPKGN